MIRVFQKLPTTDQVLDRVQSNIDGAFRRLAQMVPIVDGRLVTDVALTTSTSRIEHGLARRPQGWIVVGRSADARVWDMQNSNNLQDRYLDLRASGAVTVSIWVF